MRTFTTVHGFMLLRPKRVGDVGDNVMRNYKISFFQYALAIGVEKCILYLLLGLPTDPGSRRVMKL